MTDSSPQTHQTAIAEALARIRQVSADIEASMAQVAGETKAKLAALATHLETIPQIVAGDVERLVGVAKTEAEALFARIKL